MSTKQTPTNGPARAMSDAELLRMQEADGRLRRYPQAPAPAGYIHPDNVRRLEAGETVAFRKKPYQGERAIPVFIGSAPVAGEAVPPGYAILPVKQTPEMHDAVMELLYAGVPRTNTQSLLDAYVRSAPAAPQASEANGQWRDLALKFDAQRMVFRDLLKVVAGKLAAVAGARDDEANKMLAMARDALASSPGECLKAQASGPITHSEAGRSNGDGTYEAVPVLAMPQASAEAYDRFRAAYMEWEDKTDFIQKRIASGELPVKYLGWHRADVMRDLIEKADNDARYERLEREHLGDADKGTGIYHPDNRPAQGCGCQTCRPITLEDMRMVLCPTCGNKRCPHATDHRNACTGSNEPGQPGSSYGVPATLATMLLWLKRRMTWGMVSIPGAEVARLVAEIEALQRGQHDAGIEARARQLVADAAASGQVVRIDLVPRQPLAMGNLEMVVDVRAARVRS